MRRDPCTFREVFDSLSDDEWEEIYGAVLYLMRGLLRKEQGDRTEILQAAVAGLSQVRLAPEFKGSEEDYASAAVTYYLAFRQKYEWGSLGRLKGALINKAKELFLDSKKPRKSWEASGGLPPDETPDNPEQALLRKEKIQLSDHLIKRFKQFLLTNGTANDRAAIQLFEFCQDEDSALTETKTKEISFKSKKVIEPGLRWDAEKVQRVRVHMIERGKLFLAQENGK
jgi:hypothetical protein